MWKIGRTLDRRFYPHTVCIFYIEGKYGVFSDELIYLQLTLPSGIVTFFYPEQTLSHVPLTSGCVKEHAGSGDEIVTEQSFFPLSTFDWSAGENSSL